MAQLVDRLRRLREQQDFRVLAVSGGAAANRLLRRELSTWCVDQGVELRMVALEFTGDNAAMIAHTALLRHRSGELGDRLDVDASSRIPF